MYFYKCLLKYLFTYKGLLGLCTHFLCKAISATTDSHCKSMTSCSYIEWLSQNSAKTWLYQNLSNFGTLNVEEVEQLQVTLQNKNAIANEKKSARFFKDYLQNIGLEDTDFYHFTESELDHYLRTFWFNACQKNGKRYSCSSLETIRYGLNRSLKRSGHNFDITSKVRTSFLSSIKAFGDAQALGKSLGNGVIKSHKLIAPRGKFPLYFLFILDR